MSTETPSTELVPVERPREYATPAERLKAAEMPVLRRTPQELADEQAACDMILQKILGTNSLLLPEDLRRDPKAVLTLISYARDAGLHHVEVLQNAFCVKGKIAFNTKFLIAQLRRRFSVQPIFRFSGDGDNLVCHVSFVDLSRVDSVNGDPLPVKGVEFSLTMKEGLASSNGSEVWKKQPKKMLMYRTAKIAIDTYWPGVLGFDSGEYEEYVEWSNVGQYVPTEGIRAVKIMGPPVPVDPKLEQLLAAPTPAPTPIVDKPQLPPPVQESKTTPLLSANSSAFDDFKERFKEADSKENAQAVWNEVKAAFDQQVLTDDERDELKNIYEKTYRSLAF